MWDDGRERIGEGDALETIAGGDRPSVRRGVQVRHLSGAKESEKRKDESRRSYL